MATTIARHIKPPKSGIYKAIPADEYHSWDAYSSTRGNVLLDQSAFHLRHFLDNGSADTDAKTRGTLLHALLLEPDRFKKEYVVGPDVNLSTKVGKEEWEKFKNANRGKNLVRGKDGERIEGMRASIWKHPLALSLLEAKGDNELSGVFKINGVTCKFRVDKLVTALGCAVDLKKTTDSGLEFHKRIYEYGYHRQGALYMAGLDEVGVGVENYNIIAVEESAPYAVCVHRLTQIDLDIGATESAEAIDRYKQCLEGKFWPGVGYNWKKKCYEPVPVVAPKWRLPLSEVQD